MASHTNNGIESQNLKHLGDHFMVCEIYKGRQHYFSLGWGGTFFVDSSQLVQIKLYNLE